MQPQQMLHGVVLRTVELYWDHAGTFEAGRLFLAWRIVSRRYREIADDDIAHEEAGMVLLKIVFPSAAHPLSLCAVVSNKQ